MAWIFLVQALLNALFGNGKVGTHLPVNLRAAGKSLVGRLDTKQSLMEQGLVTKTDALFCKMPE